MDGSTTGGTAAGGPAGAPRAGGLPRRHVLGALLAFPLAGCVGVPIGAGGAGTTTDPGGTASAPGGDAGAGGRRLAGHLVVKDSELTVLDAATGRARSFPAAETSSAPGVGVSRSGVIGDVWDYFGPASDSWHVTVRSLAGEQLADYTVGGPLSFPTSAATLDPTASRLAYSVDEPQSQDGDAERIDRVYVYDLRTGAVLSTVDGRAEPVLTATGELLVRAEDAIHVYDAQYADQGPAGLKVSPRAGAFDVSPDGRYVVAESDFRLRGLDRTTGRTWQVADELHRAHTSPAFSPDGRWLAFLRAGAVASQYLAVIPFVPGRTREVVDGDDLRSPAGDFYGGTGRIGWAA